MMTAVLHTRLGGSGRGKGGWNLELAILRSKCLILRSILEHFTPIHPDNPGVKGAYTLTCVWVNVENINT